MPFNGRVHGRPLAPGRYLIDVVVVRGKSHKRVGRVAVEIVKPGRQLTKAQLAAPVGVACVTSTSSPSLPAAAVITTGAGASGPGDPARGGKSLPGRVLRAIFKPPGIPGITGSSDGDVGGLAWLGLGIYVLLLGAFLAMLLYVARFLRGSWNP